MTQEKEYHTLRRNDGSVVVYYTLDNDPAHYVVYDTLDAHSLAAEVARLKAQVEALKEAAQMAYEDLEQYEYTDLPGGYAVMATARALRAALGGE